MDLCNRLIFTLLSTLVFVVSIASISPEGFTNINMLMGLFLSIVFVLTCFFVESRLAKTTLKTLNLCLIGLSLGCLLSSAFMHILEVVIIKNSFLNSALLDSIKAISTLFFCFLTTIATIKAKDELLFSIPFVQLVPKKMSKKEIIVDPSILQDPRILGLATSGLLDNQLVFPSFALKELVEQAESMDETLKAKANRSLEVLKKLESLPHLQMSKQKIDFPEIKSTLQKLIHLAKTQNASVITSDISLFQGLSLDDISVINLQTLSNTLKPVTPSGEILLIKIQRYGKEPSQGIGYLEDGTMIVVNGGAEFIGETIKAQVLSVKYTSAGRMIFCNTCDIHDPMQTQGDVEQITPQTYFALNTK